MRKKMIKTISLAVVLMFFIVSSAIAITITVSPNPAYVGDSVNIKISAQCGFGAGGYCTLTIDYGDQNTEQVQCDPYDPSSCNNISRTHTYNRAGSYIVRASGPGLYDPNPATVSLSVRSRPQPSYSLTVNPSSIKVPRGMSSVKNIYYTFSVRSGTANTTFSSSRGYFKVNGTTIGTVGSVVKAKIAGKSTRVLEVLRIPVSVLKKAEQMRSSQMTYTRRFSNGSSTLTADVKIYITTEAAAGFAITRLQLYFENYKPEITIKRNQPLPKLYAEIRYAGSGLLKGYWEVDGRRISNVFKMLTNGTKVIFLMPSQPPAPTFEPGTHVVRFVITEPDQDIPLPEAIYFVTVEGFSKKVLPIRLISPPDHAVVDYKSIRFVWRKKEGVNVYLIQFFRSNSKKPVFSAYTKKTSYTLPYRALIRIFEPSKEYLWKVKGFNLRNEMISESRTFSFSFKGNSLYLPGQIVVLVKDHNTIVKLKKKFKLSLLKSYEIRSLNLRVAVFHTDKKIFKVIDEIKPDVMVAQPNFIFRTMNDPLSSMQSTYNMMNFSALHKCCRAKGVPVAVIDTGVDVNHEDLKDRIVYFHNCLENSYYKPEIHGTAVAGIIGASVNGIGIEGIAPGVKIFALRACRQIKPDAPDGECYSSAILKALDIAIEKKVKIVNMSFGTPIVDDLISWMIREGSKRGILFVAPVGNSPSQRRVSFPASHPDVIAVAGIDYMGRYYPNGFLAQKADVYAPAVDIFTTVPLNNYNFLSGTSLSSATVSGLLALAVEKRSFNNRTLFEKDFCKWGSQLFNVPFCRQKVSSQKDFLNH